MPLRTWLSYLHATTGLSVSPGPNGLLALTHGAMSGRRKALWAVLGGSAATEFATEMLIACLPHKVAPWLHKVSRRFNQLCGGIFVAVGALLPMRT